MRCRFWLWGPTPMARKKRRAYATDLTDTQWALIAPLIPEAEPGGRPQALAGSLSFRRARLRGRRLCGAAGALGQGADPHRPGDREAQHRADGLCRDPPL